MIYPTDNNWHTPSFHHATLFIHFSEGSLKQTGKNQKESAIIKHHLSKIFSSRQHLWPLLLLLSLSSCTILAPTTLQTHPRTWTARQQQLQHITTWDLQGAIAVHAARESGSASLRWQQMNQHYRLSLAGPLGAHALEIVGQPGLVILRSATSGQQQAASPEDLVYAQTGWTLPVSALHYWIRGLPIPGEKATIRLDHYHRLATLSQQQWQIHFNEYLSVNGVDLPRRIHLSHPPFNIKIVIYQWGNV